MTDAAGKYVLTNLTPGNYRVAMVPQAGYQLTTVPTSYAVNIAADGTAITGWTTEVSQKAGSTTTRFRVGIASSGDKVAFVFLNPQKGLDVTAADWSTVAVRAVQRETQQS